MDCNEPCAGEIDEVVQLIRIGDAIDGGVEGEEEKEDVRDVSPPTQ